MNRWRGHYSTLATGPLTSVCIALALATVPVLDRVAPWAVAIFAVAILLRLLVNRQRLRLPSVPVKVGLLVIGLGGVAVSYGGLIGIEPGLGVLLILLSLKLLETNTVRDFQVLVLLGWFLCLCGLFFSQDLSRWLYAGFVALLLAASLIRFHHAPQGSGFVRPFGLAVKLLAQALPIAALLFVFFPRNRGDFRFQFSRSVIGVTGMSDQLSPGSFAALTRNDSRAFRADFPDGNVPPLSQLYWRGAVLWRGDGMNWARGSTLMPVENATGQLAGPTVRQNIILDPHGGRWLFALDRPAVVARDSEFQAGGFLQSLRPIVAPLRYTVISRPENHEAGLMPDQRALALSLPTRVSPQVQGLVASWRARGATDREVADAALHFFRKENFVYSLEPNVYGKDPLSEFLFQRRSGFCEHYAAAFATLMRIAGIPARVVIGYHGGEFNRLGNYVLVRQLDAHAWAEVWLKGEGWVRVDPTNVIAPDRISSGSESFLESRVLGENATAETSVSAAGMREMLREARLAWDNIKYQWDLRVVNYDEEAQQTLFNLAGLADFAPSVIVLWTAGGALLFLGILAAWLARPRRERADPLVRDYRRFCRTLANAGIAREPWEGPQHFAERAAVGCPQQADAIREAAALYIAARYDRQASAAASFKRAVRGLPRLSKLAADEIKVVQAPNQ